MKLTDFFPNANGQVKNTGVRGGAQTTRADAGLVSRQIRALTPGQTLQGEVVARNGDQVQIKVSDDLTLEARVDRNMNLESGKTMTFEVRNNGQTLTLSPLFANTASQENALKALEMASLPVNRDTMSMTGLMMRAGLSIDKNSLQQMFREVNTFPEADISDVVDLHKLGLPVNEENLTQISSYKNLNHQLLEGMRTVLDALPETVSEMIREGNTEGAARMFGDLLHMIEQLAADAEGENAGIVPQETAEEVLAGQIAGLEGELTEGDPEGAISGAQNTETQPGQTALTQVLTESDIQGAAGEQFKDGMFRIRDEAQNEMQNELTDLVKNLQPDARESLLRFLGSGEDANRILTALGQNESYGESLRQLSRALLSENLPEQAAAIRQLLEQGAKNHDPQLQAALMGNKGVQHLLSEGMTRLWTIEPKDVADSEKMKALYSGLDRQLKVLAQDLEQNGQTHSTAFKAVSNMNQNLDFMQQINQAYTYVQIPLRLQQGEAHGDLYVYTNKRSLAAKDGQISALLHLDMEHLGAVDVYVAMQAEHVNTKFYVQDDAILDFLEEHMDLLTERLQKRGYNCGLTMQVRGEGDAADSGIMGLVAQEQAQPIAQYAFDVRA
ncbi:MAG: flagellar hook-length control protein FliK [Clostridium sp.]|nr:flagellar hook-length control protein FliK [Acetatifactor muris]MCM1527975.1 flagellar hook-length control protein FliK [Bacteroides sp.]MCM1564231.1 flagellar hook-length control protein FliK [Clostridium sp.]